MDDRVALQTDKTEFSVTLFLGQQRQYYQHAGLLCTDYTINNSGDKKEDGNKEIVCQYD